MSNILLAYLLSCFLVWWFYPYIIINTLSLKRRSAALDSTIGRTKFGVYFSAQRRKQKTTSVRNLFDAADFGDLMVLCLGAGHTISGAFKEATHCLGETDMGKRGWRVLARYNRGCSLSDALRFEKSGCESDAFVELAESLLLGLHMGNNLNGNMESLSEGLRKSAQTQLEVRAAQAPVKMLFPLVCFIFPAIFILLGAGVIRDLLQAL